MKKQSSGFTLIETIIALSIYIILIAALMAASQNNNKTLSTLEKRTLAGIAINNIMIEFKESHNPIKAGRFHGNYSMSHFNYSWEVLISPSQAGSTNIMTTTITEIDSSEVLATQKQVL